MPEATLRAARTLLERMPASSVSVRELARGTGVSHGAPYRHFGDRQGLLVALAARCLAEFVRTQEAAVGAAPPGQRLLDLGEAYVRYAARAVLATTMRPTMTP